MTRDYFLNRAALHQRLSALRHKHFEEVMKLSDAYITGQIRWASILTRLRDLSNARQMHAEIARDYMLAANMAEVISAAIPQMYVRLPEGTECKRLDGRIDVWRDGAWQLK